MFALFFQNIRIKFLSLETIALDLKTKPKCKLLTIKEPLQLIKQIITRCSLLIEHSGKMLPFVWVNDENELALNFELYMHSLRK